MAVDLYSKDKVRRRSKQPTFADKVFHQIGALCFKVTNGKTFILLITSRRSKRWIIPKGWKLDKLSSRKSAALEAWEEAGVQGRVFPRAIGSYYYRKRGSDEEFYTCSVSVFPLRVAKMKKKFPEKGERKLKWLSASKAGSLVVEPELKALIKSWVKKSQKSETKVE